LPDIAGRTVAPVRGESLADQTDEQLLAGLHEGSEGHFTQLYERYFRRIYTFAYARVRNYADAEEIAQETFMAVFRSVGAFRGQSSLLSWIYGIAKNTANNHLRRLKAQEQRLQALEPDAVAPMPSIEHAGPSEQLDMRAYTDALERRLSALADWQLEIFCMRHLENLSIEEISDRTRRSSDAVRSSLYRVKRVFVETAEGASA
jgi:RNA polymerase sigma-70 factor (ECF subfamily)